MFTGLVQEVGRVLKKQVTSNQVKLRIMALKSGQFQLGDSVAVNGACLTVTFLTKDWFEADVMPKTWEDTNLKFLTVNSPVNLESAVKLGDSLDGHLVIGHVDGIGKIVEIKPCQNAVLLQIDMDKALRRYMVKKASIALDGVSLTVQEINGNRVLVSIIPHTFAETRFQWSKPGDWVNIEVDILAKQILANMVPVQSQITVDFLKEYGFIK